MKIEAMVERSSSPARESSPAFEVQDSIVLRAPTPVEASASPAPIPTPEPAPEPSVADAIPKARTPPKEAKTPTSRPTSKGKDAAPTQEDFGLGLDTSILEEAPQYTSAAKTPSPVASDPSIMAPPMDLFDDSPEAQKPVEEPRTMPPPPSPAAAPRTPTLPRTDPNLHAEYIAALHARPSSTSKPKVTYTSSNKSIKRKAEEESPEGRRVKKEVAAGEGQTTFENLRQLSLGLRVRGQRGGEVC